MLPAEFDQGWWVSAAGESEFKRPGIPWHVTGFAGRFETYGECLEHDAAGAAIAETLESYQKRRNAANTETELVLFEAAVKRLMRQRYVHRNDRARALVAAGTMTVGADTYQLPGEIANVPASPAVELLDLVLTHYGPEASAETVEK